MNNPDPRDQPNRDKEGSGSKRISEKNEALNDGERYSEQMDFIVRANQRKSPSSLQGRSFSEKNNENLILKKQLGSNQNQKLDEGIANPIVNPEVIRRSLQSCQMELLEKI